MKNIKVWNEWEIDSVVVENLGASYLLFDEPDKTRCATKHGISKKGQLFLSLEEAKFLLGSLHSVIEQYENLDKIAEDHDKE